MNELTITHITHPFTDLNGLRLHIAEGVRALQRRARAGVTNPDVLALRVTEQLGRARRGALEIGMELVDIEPYGAFWDDGALFASTVTTVVEIRSYPAFRVLVRRAAPPVNTRNGELRVNLRELGR